MTEFKDYINDFITLNKISFDSLMEKVDSFCNNRAMLEYSIDNCDEDNALVECSTDDMIFRYYIRGNKVYFEEGVYVKDWNEQSEKKNFYRSTIICTEIEDYSQLESAMTYIALFKRHYCIQIGEAKIKAFEEQYL